MFRILKRIRQSILTSGNFRSYIPYAIGEIVLVVIGILIALEINNWNQDLIERRKEKALLEQIHSEFLFNKEELAGNTRDYLQIEQNCRKMIGLFPIDTQTVHLDTLAKYLQGIDFNGSFDMSNGSVQSLKNTYSFEIISDEALRTLLIRIDDLVADYTEREMRSIDFVEMEMMPYLQSRIPIPFHKGIKDDRVDHTFLTSITFENLIRERAEKIRVFLGLAEKEDRPLHRAIDQIIELSASD